MIDCRWQEENTLFIFPVWAFVNLKGTFSSSLIFPQGAATYGGVSFGVVYAKPLKQHRLAAIPNSISKAKAMASAKLAWKWKQSHLGVLTAPFRTAPPEAEEERGGGRRKKKVFAQVKTAEKKCPVNQVVDEMWSNVEIRFWVTVRLSEILQREKSKSLFFTSSGMVNVDSVGTWYFIMPFHF